MRLQGALGDNKARVIMDVVQYEGVNWASWQRAGNREVCTDEWLDRLECWRAPIEPKICLTFFWHCPHAGNSIIQNSLRPIGGFFINSIQPNHRTSAAVLKWKTSSSVEVWTWLESWWLWTHCQRRDGVTFHWMLLYPTHGFFSKMQRCHCYKRGLLCQRMFVAHVVHCFSSW